ncbi:flagellar biosynthesis protein FlhB [Hwanghaeella grinnelliae]|uniref:Flagellar biosynthetic protein FlhB n=1 Tax=Hwanghaeella grinnelliae TaxID=2500179 RepID=A0A437QJF5_9PROT|nr:flagellar biosynthesis protein FlhB [Hwanghaeella grinnelliae]RVU34635.1 flagellar biosynthesis protein FlhB [Hwanghaeella grinnelliae]
MASNDDADSKTEEPTGKRLADARQKGQLPTSREVPTWIMLFGTAIMLALMAPFVASRLKEILVAFVARPHSFLYGPAELGASMTNMLLEVLGVMAWPLIMFAVLAASGYVLQNGWVIVTEPMKPKLSKINPITGAKKYFQAKTYVEFLKNFLKLAVVAAVGIVLVIPEFNRLDLLPSLTSEDHLQEILILILRILAGVLSILFAIMVFDIFFQRMQHRKQLRMTKQEIKEEFKNQEGDPQIKSRLRQIRMERARTRMMQAVPDADVVVTNPTHFACALSYNPDEMEAPVLVAKGQDLVAKRIRDLAEEHDIPIIENPPLARALHATCDLDQQIPEEHYKAVAEVISFVWRLKGKMSGAQK